MSINARLTVAAAIAGLCVAYHGDIHEISPKEYLHITAVGDIMMGTTWPDSALPPDDGAGIFDQVKPLLSSGDIVFGNLESPLVDSGQPSKCQGDDPEKNRDDCYEFRTPTRYREHLRNAGFNVVSIANNHANDFGPEGLRSTIEALASVGIQPAGGQRVAFFEAKGKRIAVVGFSFINRPRYSYSLLDTTGADRIVRDLRRRHDIVIVSVHGGAEGKDALHARDADEVYRGERRGNIVRFARQMVDSGAAMVIGHGPHVPRALELYKGKLIAYSLGNFLTYGSFDTIGPSGTSMVLHVQVDPDSGDFAGGKLVPVRLAGRGIPAIDSSSRALNLVRGLMEADLESRDLMLSDTGELVPRRPAGVRPYRGIVASVPGTGDVSSFMPSYRN